VGEEESRRWEKKKEEKEGEEERRRWEKKKKSFRGHCSDLYCTSLEMTVSPLVWDPTTPIMQLNRHWGVGHLADQVGAGGARVSGQQQQQGGQQHRVQDEEQVVDQDSDQDQIPGQLPRLAAAAASDLEGGARHVDTQEDGAQAAVHAPRQQPEEEEDGSALVEVRAAARRRDTHTPLSTSERYVSLTLRST